MKSIKIGTLVLVTAAVGALRMPPGRAGSGSVGLQEGTFLADNYQRDGVTFETQAGAHPDMSVTKLQFNTTFDGYGHIVPDGNVKTIAVDLPPGMSGNPSATPNAQGVSLDIWALQTHVP